jgi:enoyl-CoA hydratase
VNLLHYNFLEVEQRGGVGIVKINRPPANAISYEMVEDLLSFTDDASSNDTIKAITITGTNDFFVGGADIKMMQQHRDKDLPSFMEAYTVHLQRAFNKIEEIPKPVIAAINGYALGGGCELALACDFRYMAKGKAKIGLPEVKLGLLPGAGGLQRLPRLVGKGKALEMIVKGSLLNAEEAREIGLVNDIFDQNELFDKTFEFADDLSKQATLSIGMIKRCINYGLNTNLKAGMSFDIECQDKLFKTADGMEGILAFIEKRKPVFQGK